MDAWIMQGYLSFHRFLQKLNFRNLMSNWGLEGQFPPSFPIENYAPSLKGLDTLREWQTIVFELISYWDIHFTITKNIG